MVPPPSSRMKFRLAHRLWSPVPRVLPLNDPPLARFRHTGCGPTCVTPQRKPIPETRYSGPKNQVMCSRISGIPATFPLRRDHRDAALLRRIRALVTDEEVSRAGLPARAARALDNSAETRRPSTSGLGDRDSAKMRPIRSGQKRLQRSERADEGEEIFNATDPLESARSSGGPAEGEEWL